MLKLARKVSPSIKLSTPLNNLPAPGLIQRCKIIEEAKQGNAPSVASTRAADCRWLSNRVARGLPQSSGHLPPVTLHWHYCNCNSVHLPCNCNKHFIPCLGFNDFFMAFFYTIWLLMLDAHFVLHIFTPWRSLIEYNRYTEHILKIIYCSTDKISRKSTGILSISIVLIFHNHIKADWNDFVLHKFLV